MKIALLDVRRGKRNPENSNTVAYRNLLKLSRALPADLYCDVAQLKKARHDYDAIVCGFYSTSGEIDNSRDFLIANKKARIYWLVGEYEQHNYVPLYYSKREFTIIKNFEHIQGCKGNIGEVFLNFNLILFDKPTIPRITPVQYSNVYYGRWREDRAVYVNRYLGTGAYLSTSPKNMKVFLGQCPTTKNATMVKNLSWERGRESLRLFAPSLYLEDVFTHTHYNCPANRFYEALNCGTIILTQPEAANTWERAGIAMGSNRVVADREDYIGMARNIMSQSAVRMDYLHEQYEWGKWCVAQKKQLLDDLKQLLNGGVINGQSWS